MTSAEDEQRVEFLERQFTGIDHRFDEVNRQITELRHDGLGHFMRSTGDANALSRSTTRSRRPCAGSRRDSPAGVAGARSSSATSRR